MSANRRHRRGRVWSTEGAWRRLRGIQRETNRKWDAVTKACARSGRSGHGSRKGAKTIRELTEWLLPPDPSVMVEPTWPMWASSSKQLAEDFAPIVAALFGTDPQR